MAEATVRQHWTEWTRVPLWGPTVKRLKGSRGGRATGGRSVRAAQEEILFAFQSANEEFVFTDQALSTVCGENATTTRKLVLRYEYRENPLSKVQFETTGRVDRECEIKFQIGEYLIFIDIAKKEEELVKTHYKTLSLEQQSARHKQLLRSSRRSRTHAQTARLLI
ncbi:P-loop containing nucleoside triphosphate hydrolase [Globisporangium polare]